MEVIKPKKKKQCLMKVGLPQLCLIRPEELSIVYEVPYNMHSLTVAGVKRCRDGALPIYC